jgi:hypothetical protein
VLLGCLWYFTLGSTEKYKTLPQEVHANEKDDVTTGVSFEPDNKIKSGHKTSQEDVNDYAIANIDKKSSVDEYCGEEYNNFLEFMKVKSKKNDFTDKQLNATNRMKKACKDWQDYVGQLSDETLKKQTLEFQEIKEINQFFLGEMDAMDQNKIEEARLIMSAKTDTLYLSTLALSYLMKFDRDFVKEIASRLNSSNINYINSSEFNIISLYQCQIDPEFCYEDAFLMSFMCIDKNAYCGMTRQQLIAHQVTSNHYIDLLNIVDIIQTLINEDYWNQ